MPGAKEFLEKYLADPEFAAKVSAFTNNKEKYEFCQQNGFSFTKEEMLAALDERHLTPEEVIGGADAGGRPCIIFKDKPCQDC